MDISLWFTLKTLSIAFVISTAFYIISIWQKKRASSLYRIPSPPGLPFIGHLHYFLNTKENNPLKIAMKVGKKFHESGIFRIELFNGSSVFIFKPKYLQTFYTMNSMEKASFYRPLDDILNPSSFLSHGKLWKKLRKLLLINFFGTPTHVFYKNFRLASDRLVGDLKEKANGQPFPFHDYALFTTGSTICFNGGYDVNIDEYKKIFTYSVPFVIKQGIDRNFKPLYLFKPIFKLTKNGREFYRVIKEAQNAVEKMCQKIRNRLNGNKYVDNISMWRQRRACAMWGLYKKCPTDGITTFVPRCVMYYLKNHKIRDSFFNTPRTISIEMLNNGNPVPELYLYNILKNPSEEANHQLLSEMMTLFGAGTDTTGNTFGFLLIVLGLFPEIQEKIFKEDREILSKLHGGPETVEDLRNYKYLECVIKETLRLFPIGPIIGRKLEEDTKFGDYVIPKNTNVLVLQMYVNYDPEVFPEPFTFKPERFFKENESSIPPYTYNPFSAGPRSCPGKQYAMMSLKTMTTAILRQYRVLSAYKNLEEAISNAEIGMSLYDKNDFPIKLVPRV